MYSTTIKLYKQHQQNNVTIKQQKANKRNQIPNTNINIIRMNKIEVQQETTSNFVFVMASVCIFALDNFNCSMHLKDIPHCNWQQQHEILLTPNNK